MIYVCVCVCGCVRARARACAGVVWVWGGCGCGLRGLRAAGWQGLGLGPSSRVARSDGFVADAILCGPLVKTSPMHSIVDGRGFSHRVRERSSRQC